MNFEEKEMRLSVRDGYRILLRAEAFLLLPAEHAKIAEFYKGLAGRCMEWAEETHGERLKAEYAALTSIPEKAAFRTQRYLFRMRKVFENEQYLAMICESKLTEQWKAPNKSYHRLSHVWNLKEGSMLPFSQILSVFGPKLPKKAFPFPPDGIYPEGEKTVFFRNPTESAPFMEKALPREVKVEI